jgi:Haem-dependent oxidative N-demethylase, alpha subunit-like
MDDMETSGAQPAPLVRTAIPMPGPPPLYLPFQEGPWRMAMGLIAQPLAALFEIDSDYAEQMALRRQLLAERHAEVFGALEESARARRALLDLLATHLPEHHPAWFVRTDARLANRLTGEEWDLERPPCDPLELAGRLVQEDLCLLEPGPEGTRLTAAVLCFPTRWRLAAKLGRPMGAIHGPVPFFAERLAGPVERFMAMLKPGRLVERVNWSVHDNPALFQPVGHGRADVNPAITAANAGEKLWLRVERQTLSRVPATAAILFTIKIHRRPLAEIAALPGVAARLAGAVRALPPETAQYQSFPAFRVALLAYLDSFPAPGPAD